jgi:hypothetical protein
VLDGDLAPVVEALRTQEAERRVAEAG